MLLKLIKSFHSQAWLLSTISCKINSQCFFISFQHVLEPSTVSLLLTLFRVIWKIQVLCPSVLFLTVEFKQILQLILRNTSNLEPFLKYHLFLISLLKSFTVLFSLNGLITTGFLCQDASLMHLHIFFNAYISIIPDPCQA